MSIIFYNIFQCGMCLLHVLRKWYGSTSESTVWNFQREENSSGQWTLVWLRKHVRNVARAERVFRGSLDFARFSAVRGWAPGKQRGLAQRVQAVRPLHGHPGLGFFSGLGLGIKQTKTHGLLFLRKTYNTREETGGLCWWFPAWSHGICFQHHRGLSRRGPPVSAAVTGSWLSRSCSGTCFVFHRVIRSGNRGARLRKTGEVSLRWLPVNVSLFLFWEREKPKNSFGAAEEKQHFILQVAFMEPSMYTGTTYLYWNKINHAMTMQVI